LSNTPSIGDLIRAASGQSAAAQSVPWNNEKWVRWLPPPNAGTVAWHNLLAELRGACTGESHAIRRTDVTSFGQTDPHRLFLAAMVWGFGTTGFGAWRTGQMIATPGFSTSLTDIINTVRRDGAEVGFATLTSSGQSRIRRLGPSYGTKLLFFAGDGYPHRPQPVVYDELVARALDDIAPGHWPPSPLHLTPRRYAEYCAWVEGTANELGVQPPDIEYALFVHGSTLKRGPRRTTPFASPT
jgi:hypothetical protein